MAKLFNPFPKKPMATRKIVRGLLKEWNYDDIDEEIKADEQLAKDEKEEFEEIKEILREVKLKRLLE